MKRQPQYSYTIFIPFFDFKIQYDNFKQAIKRANSLLRAGYVIEMERVAR